jgi:hypothetical protein
MPMSTPVRNTPIPKAQAAVSASSTVRREITQDMIARRAYEIWASGQGSSDEQNWLRAERELRGQ